MERTEKICLNKIYYNLTELISEAKNKDICTSLAVFKPTEILDFTAELVDREWDKDKLAKLNQLNLLKPTMKVNLKWFKTTLQIQIPLQRQSRH